MAWPALLQDLVVREPGEQQQAQLLGQLAAEFRRDGTPVIKLVEALGPWLTGEDDAQRSRATGALSEVVEAVPTAASSEGEVRHLVQFFTARLTDWPAVRGALRGCLVLVSRHPGALPPPQQPDQVQQPQQAPQQQLPAPDDAAVVELMRTCVSHVFIRALAAADRQLALRLLAAAVRGYGDALLGANLDLLEYTISSVDGEKDPRCLLLSFEAIQALLQLYHRQPEEALCRERLEESAEELFEVLACYFPVTFTPPPNDPNKITRADLAQGLERTLAAEPLFAPYVVPLMAEKLSSSIRQAKLDALSLLGACATAYGPAPLADHASALWAALRPELAAPAAEGLLPADLAAVEELADAAAAALASCVTAFQRPASENEEGGSSSGTAADATLADAVLQDPLVSDMLACIQAPGHDATTHRRSALRAKVGARAARALCASGGAAASRALAQLLPPLLEAAAGSGGSGAGDGSSASWQAQCLAWAAILDLLEAAAAAPAVAAADGGPDGGLVATAVGAAAAALAASAQEQAAVAAEEGEEEDEAEDGSRKPAERWVLHPSDCGWQQATVLQLALLAAVLAAPRLTASLNAQQVAAAADSTLEQLTAAGGSRARQQQAVAPLRALASSSHAAVVAERVLPRLVTAAGQPQSAAAALAALRALAEASSGLQLDIVLALDQAIQQQLSTALGPAGSISDAALLQQLLAAATGIVAAAPGGGEGEAGAAAGVLPLAHHLFDAVILLPAQAAAAAAPELTTACAELSFHAVRSAAAEQQQPLAAAAAEALLEQQPVGLQAAVCCALLLPLRPGVAEAAVGGQLAGLVEPLVQRALSQPSSNAAGRWAALAAAALLNKWPQADAERLAACASVISGQLLPACGLADLGTSSSRGVPVPTAQPGAWGCLAAVARGLAMRGHREADAVLQAVIAYLGTAAQHWQQAAADPDGTATAASVRQAAQFLGSALDGSSGGVGLNKQSHAVAKPLWQQRCYTAATRQLLPLLEASQQQALSAGAAGSPGSGSPRTAQASPVLLLALGHLLQAAPAGVQQQEQQRMLPWLLQCLAGLQEGPLADEELLLALLLLLSDALMTPAGKQQVETDLLPRLVPALLGLIGFRPSPAVRETALQCLLLLLELPYTALHPYRQAVEKGLAAAVDDNRRAVRLAAARCRQAWSSA